MMKKTTTQQRPSERGQSIILLAFVFVGFLIIVGLAVDLGLVYIERVRLGRAVDAAALGGVPELPQEDAAFVRALMFLSENGYDATNSIIIFNGTQVVTPTNPIATLIINTADYRELDEHDDPIENSARRLRVEGVRQVPLHFMKFAGPWFSEVPVSSQAVAENVQNLDVSVVIDRSGSMEFDTICYGCWEVDNNRGYDYDHWPSGEEYPGGVRYPLAYPHELCSGYDPEDMYYTYAGNEYVVIEAEHYTNNWPPFDPDYRTNKTSYWGIQRSGVGSSTFNDSCSGPNWRAGCGGYVQHNPFCVYPEDVEQVYDSSELAQAPQLTYEFQVPQSATYRLWLRGEGANNSYSSNVDTRTIHWGVDGTYEGTSTDFLTGPMYDGASYGNWRWRRVDSFYLTAGVTHTLQIFAGGAGFRLDKIVLTNGPDSEADNILLNGGGANGRKGPDATAGRSGYACWPCNPIYGPPSSPECEAAWAAEPVWQSMYNTMFDDQQPIRATKEAVKLFLDPPQDVENRLDPGFDQVGLISYSNRARTDSELECLWRGDSCISFEIVEDATEELDSDGSTNIGEALLFGINILDQGGGHHGRFGTKRFIILLTDGVPNQRTGVSGCGDPYPYGDVNHDCAVHMAEVARDNGITIYTIGLGEGADEVLLNWIADLTDGAYFPAPSKDDLNDIFLQILSRIYIRLVK